MSTFQRAVDIQLRVIGALMLQNFVTTTKSSSLGFLSVALRPTMIIAGMYIAGSVAKGLAPHGFPLLIFSVTGYLTWYAFIQYFIAINFSGGAKLLMFPHVTPLDLMLAKLAVDFVVYTTIFIAFGTLGTLFEQTPPPADPLGVMVGFWSALLMGLSLGLIVTCVTRITSIFNDLIRAVHYLGHFVSGVFLLATDTPTPLLKYLRWNPVFHCVEMVRQSWWAPYKSPIADMRYVFLCIFFLVAIGLALERVTRRWDGE